MNYVVFFILIVKGLFFYSFRKVNRGYEDEIYLDVGWGNWKRVIEKGFNFLTLVVIMIFWGIDNKGNGNKSKSK